MNVCFARSIIGHNVRHPAEDPGVDGHCCGRMRDCENQPTWDKCQPIGAIAESLGLSALSL